MYKYRYKYKYGPMVQQSFIMQKKPVDYPKAEWIPANENNYTKANRPIDWKIDYIIIHTTEGSLQNAIDWFQNPEAKVSAHYLIGKDGVRIVQSVRDKNIAHHAGNKCVNYHSIGIEHEGFIDDPNAYSKDLYRTSAYLTRWLCNKHGILKDRKHIIGHSEVPLATHTDPGQYWDWEYYMSLVNLRD
jgi:N-acetyl-anhydromuramyl-L-alanine amidase AmpD